MIPKLQNLCYEDRLKRKQNAQFHAIKSTNVLLKTSKVAVYSRIRFVQTARKTTRPDNGYALPDAATISSNA